MAGTEPGERRDERAGAPKAQLERPPSERYATAERPSTDAPAAGAAASPLFLAVLRASLVALIGAAALYAVGALVTSTAGLLFVAGLTGAAVGLLLARAAVPGDAVAPALARRQVRYLAMALSIAAVLAGAVATWLNALGEGGTLGFLDYQLQTFGVYLPGEVVLAAITAAWGAGAGPIEG
jgi:hypothetical protein